MKIPILILLAIAGATLAGPKPNQFEDPNADVNALPVAADGFEIALWAKEPLVRNPCALAFDARGRMCVGMGPQYRKPTPRTPGDSVWIVEDKDGDGVAESRKEFATGFNCVQALAWRGRDLWVANAPDLTVVRDLDGDDVADEYVRVFTDLGNLEHGLHGLTWAPDGLLYMSKGNSKGLTLPGRVAPLPFRELAGISDLSSPATPPRTFAARDYQHTFQDPEDDWGREGGVLRCDDGGAKLEIVARGLRNPWDIAHDAGFDWLGTDQDQNDGDRIFAPFPGAHFGWGHPWSAHWTGKNHPPTAPVSGPVFVGSGTGVTWADVPGWPATHRGVFLLNDWLLKRTCVYRPRWEGALRLPVGDPYAAPLVAGSEALFRPTDMEFGPDGALYILGWGRSYGLALENGQPANEGRIYRVAPRGFSPWKNATAEKRARPFAKWTFAELAEDLAAWIPAWRTDAADELARRGATDALRALLADDLPPAQRTWALWTLGRIAPGEAGGDSFFAAEKTDRINAVRILGHRAATSSRAVAPVIAAALGDAEPRVRLAAVLALREAGQGADALVAAAAVEKDRVTFYALWKALRQTAKPDELHALLRDPRGGVRRAALLALAENRALSAEASAPFTTDADAETAQVAALYLAKLGGKPARPARATDDGWPLRLQPANLQTGSGKLARTAALREGGRAYTDRTYTLQRVPPLLAGATFIATPNDDAGSKGRDALAFNLPMGATVFIAHDTRMAGPPKWMAVHQPNGFADSDLTLATSDGTFRLWQKDFPAGRVAFGGNTEDGDQSGKSHYLVILKAAPLAPPQEPAKEANVLAALRTADAKRGEWVFAGESGAGCYRCHRIGERGRAFGPDLTGAGERGDPAHLIRSILDPNAVLTEGFGLLSIRMKSNAAHAGTLIGESDLALTLAQADGPPLILPKADIARRESLHVSPMPPYAAMLSAQQCADVTAFLLAKNPPAAATPAAPQGLAFSREENSLLLTQAGQPLGEYVFRDAKIPRPYFAKLHAPDGTQVTRNFPPVKGVDATDHDTMHPGLALAFGDLNGVDFWRNKGRIEHVRFVHEPRVEDGRLSFAVEEKYLAPDGIEVCRGTNEFCFVAGETLQPALPGTLLMWSTTLRRADGSLTFGPQHEMGLSFRIATPLVVKGGTGSIVSSHGGKNEAGNWGRAATWWNYAGTVGGKHAGILAIAALENARPVWAHARDYGFLAMNPTGPPPGAKDVPSVPFTIPAGEPLRMRFALLLHSTPATAPLRPAPAASAVAAELQKHEWLPEK